MAVDAAVGAHGAEDRVASEFHVVDCFHEGVEPGVQIFAPLEEKAGGTGVPVDGAIVGEIVVLSELPRGAPVEEFLFDGFAFGMVADDAFAAVALKGRLHFQLLSAANGSGFFVVKLLVNLRAILRVVFLLAVFLLALGVMVI